MERVEGREIGDLRLARGVLYDLPALFKQWRWGNALSWTDVLNISARIHDVPLSTNTIKAFETGFTRGQHQTLIKILEVMIKHEEETMEETE